MDSGLRLKLGSDRRENLRKCVSDVLQFFFRAIFSDRKYYFLQILRGFGRCTAKRTAPSARASNFALDSLLLKSVRPKFHPIPSCTVCQHVSSLGTTICLIWEPTHVLRENQHMSSWEPTHVLLENEHTCSVGTRKCLEWNTRDVFSGTQEMP